jgi:hypothetical protein
MLLSIPDFHRRHTRVENEFSWYRMSLSCEFQLHGWAVRAASPDRRHRPLLPGQWNSQRLPEALYVGGKPAQALGLERGASHGTRWLEVVRDGAALCAPGPGETLLRGRTHRTAGIEAHRGGAARRKRSKKRYVFATFAKLSLGDDA